MAPKKAAPRCSVALRPGDRVSAAAYSWGAAYAREKGDKGGRNAEIRVEGTVVEAKDSMWVCDFGDEENIAWKRHELRFVSHLGEEREAAQRGAKRSRPAPRQDSSDEEEAEADPHAAGCGDSDHSSEIEEADAPGRVGRANHAMPAAGLVADSNWIRDDHYAVDERAKNGFTAKNPPSIVNMQGGFENGTLFDCAKHFFPMNYLEAMAAEMTEVGLKKAAEGQRRYAGWQVTSEDMLQWIGVYGALAHESKSPALRHVRPCKTAALSAFSFSCRYFGLNTPKCTTSSPWRTWVVCGGRRMTCRPTSLQCCSNSKVKWEPWPSIMRMAG